MNIDEFLEHVGEVFSDMDLLYPTDMKDAIIGYVERCGTEPVILLHKKKCVNILVQQGMSEEDALEFFEYNVIGSYLGEGTPYFATLVEDL